MDWVALDLGVTRDALQRWKTMEERGQWVCGFHMGASGAILMGGEPEAFLSGYELGKNAREESEEKRERVAAVRRTAAEARWGKRKQPAPPDPPTDASADANASAPAMQNPSTRQDKTGHITPPLPPAGGNVACDLERDMAAIWDRVSVPKGFPAFGPWSEDRRDLLRELLKIPWDQPFAVLWSRAVTAMVSDEWARSTRVNADYLLRPPRFRHHLDAWRPTTEAPRLVPRRTPPPTPTEAEERARNRDLLARAFPPHHTGAPR